MTRSDSKRTSEDAASALPCAIKEIGRKIKEQFEQRVEQLLTIPSINGSLNFIVAPRGEREIYWLDVVSALVKGDPSPLVEHLRSERALSQADRSVLADMLAAAFTFTPDLVPHRDKGGRPKKRSARETAETALAVYRKWKQLNRDLRISDRGHNGEMRDEACRMAIGLMCAAGFGDDEDLFTFDCVRDLMDRPKSRW
jgi:hypothetical protein